MPSADFCPRPGRLATASVPEHAVQISRSKPDSLHRTPAGFTVPALDGYGLCDILPARPASAASYPISVRRSRLCSTLPSDSPSRFCPCALLVLHLHQIAQGTSTPRTVGHVRHTGRFAPAWPVPQAASSTAPARSALAGARSGQRDGRFERTKGWSLAWHRPPRAGGRQRRVRRGRGCDHACVTRHRRRLSSSCWMATRAQ